MPSWGSFSFLFGPLVAAIGIGVLLLIARATAGSSSLIEEPPRVGREEEYGLMIPVADPPSRRAAESVVAQLAAAGVRASAVQTAGGPRVMVWAEDAARARQVLDSPASP